MRFQTQAQDYTDEPLNLHTFLVKRPAATQFIRASSDAMEGAGILAGALLVVDHSLKPRTGDIVVATVRGEFMLRTLRSENGLASLVASHSDYPDVALGEDDEIWGVVVAAINRYRTR
ncbi:MAG: S24 family peptidase [Rhodothermales bacterium]|nr:S24 family peptidase [Rhodothermales bacterium]